MTRQEINKKNPKRNSYYYVSVGDKEYKYPSITSILGILSKDFLITWAGKKCAEIALDDPSLTADEVYSKHRERDVKAAGTRGKGVHNIAPKLLSGQKDAVIEQYKPYTDGLVKFFQEYKPKQIFNEKVVISHKFGIGGTCDWALEVNGERWLIDIKTSKGIFPINHIQLKFYEAALQEEGEYFDKLKILHLSGNNSFNLVDVVDNLNVLPHMKAVYLWLKGE